MPLLPSARVAAILLPETSNGSQCDTSIVRGAHGFIGRTCQSLSALISTTPGWESCSRTAGVDHLQVPTSH
jgi:hypothetical protein